MKNCHYLILCFSISILACSNPTTIDELNLKDKLSGEWMAAAFDGELRESWELDKHGWMTQIGHYIENGDTTYSAKTKMMKFEGDYVLFSLIKDSNPKIFQGTSVNDSILIFSNEEYKNPYEVKYEFHNNTKYTRTIKGYEQDSLVQYVFEFSKLNSSEK